MPLRLIPPGTRKGNRVYLVRGTLAGRRYEISTETADETAALAFKAGLELEILDRRVPQPGEALSFGQAIELYRDFRDPAKADSGRLDRLKAGMGDRPLAEIRHAFLVDHANRVMPGRAAATRNREIMRPAAAVLHHAARNGYCAWLRIELFKERRPATRAVSVDVARALIAAAPEGPRRLFLLWVFRQGMRISDTLKVRRERIDLAARTVTYHVGKADRPDVVKPLDDEIWETLVNEGDDAPKRGPLFPWTTRSGVYKWLRPLALGLGVAFTPHMARHTLGKELNDKGEGIRTIMDMLDHADIKSSARYQSTDVEVLRAAGRRLGKLGR